MPVLPFPRHRRQRVAFVLSGGASLGAVQVGMLQALFECGIRPDLFVGTSAGALNGAWGAAGYHAEGLRELERIWVALRRARLFPGSPRTAMAGLMGRRASLMSPHGVDGFIREHLRFDALEDAPIPLHVVASDISDGREVVLSKGSARQALLASIAIPGIFPPVAVDGRLLADGGIANNTPISVAVALGADEIYVLPIGATEGAEAVPTSALGMMVQAGMLMARHRLLQDIARFEHQVKLHIIPPPRDIRTSPVDFSRSAELISRSRETTRTWLATVPEQVVGVLARRRLLHPHGAPPARAGIEGSP